MQFRAAVTAAVDALEPYLREAEGGQGPAVVLPALGMVSQSLELRRWIREGGMDTIALGCFLESYPSLTTRVGHPGELAHQRAWSHPGPPAAGRSHWWWGSAPTRSSRCRPTNWIVLTRRGCSPPGPAPRHRPGSVGRRQQHASYLFYDRDGEGVDLLSRTVECTKAALGLKLFLELAARGERGLGEDVAARYDVAHEARELLCSHEAFSCPYEPETNILCFRVHGDDNHQLLVRDRLMAGGDVHLSSALIGGRRHLRLVVSSPATTRSTLQRTIEQIVSCSRAIGA